MESTKKEFITIFNRFKDTWDNINIENIKSFCEEKEIKLTSIKEEKFGFSSELDAICIVISSKKALFPRLKLDSLSSFKKNKTALEHQESLWHKVDWFYPPYFPIGKINELIYSFDNKSITECEEEFERLLPELYTFSNIIPMIEKRMTQSQIFKKHVPLIRECVFAFYSGMKIVAIASLIPIIEDFLNSILCLKNENELKTMEKINKCFDNANKRVISLHFNNADWIPTEYEEISTLKVLNERVYLLELIRSWLKNSFYRKTDKYEKKSGFNRHIFAHAKSKEWEKPSNFFRIIGLIQAMLFVEAFALENNKVSIFPPVEDKSTESFRNEIFSCLNYQAIKQRIIATQQISDALPFNTTASDDGWLIRAGILSDKMNNEVILKLRDNGWSCYDFTDPISEGEYITVKAKKDDKDISVALLYSCATENIIYKKLSIDFEYILYIGAYYKQEHFTQNVNSVISPLNAWICPI